MHCGPTLGQRGCHSSHARTCSALAKTRRQNLPFSVKVYVSAESITSPGCMVTLFWLRKQQPKPSVEQGRGHEKGSFQDLQNFVHSKPRSVQANLVLGKDQWTLLAQRTRALRLQQDIIRDAITAGLAACALLTSLSQTLWQPSCTLWMTVIGPQHTSRPSKSSPCNGRSMELFVHGHNGPSIAGPTVADVEHTARR